MRPADGARLGLLAAIWGSSFLLIKVALEDLSPLQIVAGRLLFGSAVLVVLVASTGARLLRARGEWRALAVMAVVSNVLPFFLISWGQERISSGLASILNSTTPLFTAALAAAAIPEEHLGPLRLAGLALGFAGVAVIVGPGADTGDVAGQLAVVVASASYGVGFVFARKRLTGRRHSAVVLSTGQLLAATAMAVPLAAWDSTMREPSLTLAGGAAVALLGALGTGIAYVLYYRLVNDVGPTSASSVTYLLPIVGVALGYLVLNERLGWNAFAGAALVIAGIALAEHAVRRRAVLAAASPAGLVPRSDEPPSGA